MNERGTAAAAATGVGMAAGGMPIPEKTVRSKRPPFLFVMRDTRGREILFTGRLMDPR